MDSRLVILTSAPRSPRMCAASAGIIGCIYGPCIYLKFTFHAKFFCNNCEMFEIMMAKKTGAIVPSRSTGWYKCQARHTSLDHSTKTKLDRLNHAMFSHHHYASSPIISNSPIRQCLPYLDESVAQEPEVLFPDALYHLKIDFTNNNNELAKDDFNVFHAYDEKDSFVEINRSLIQVAINVKERWTDCVISKKR